ncbi:4760_t:CDS:2 [Paraglomus brasilianum]|uniref:4760_t:CDS:1 n=1 Tax=Paraglomus brasilianum TaxID=144538 RepID=A0A9N8ZAE0_9GLOM|nr:4760_t:CDS:2 [Paraglomus brasilianum]
MVLKKLYLALFLISLAVLSSVIATDLHTIEGGLVANDILKDVSSLESNTKILINGGQYSALVRKDGKFTIQNVPPGSYLLEVSSRRYLYPRLRVNVDASGVEAFITILGADWPDTVNKNVQHSNVNAPKTANALPYPLELKARAMADYFVPRESFSIASVFANPLIIMMGVSVVLLLVMPKMMEGLDPEALKELQENQPQNSLEMPDISGALANFMTGKSDAKTKKN